MGPRDYRAEERAAFGAEFDRLGGKSGGAISPDRDDPFPRHTPSTQKGGAVSPDKRDPFPRHTPDQRPLPRIPMGPERDRAASPRPSFSKVQLLEKVAAGTKNRLIGVMLRRMLASRSRREQGGG